MVGKSIGKYRVVDQIGRGGMGTVYRAVDETLHRDVAVKALNTELNDPGVERRFRAEAVAIARLNHPGIATIFELVQHDGEWFMVMEFVRGETLESLITREGPQPAQKAADICVQVLAALAHAHSMGVVHRDLKPANLMRMESGVVKIMDFGIARVAGTERLTSAGFMMGTPAFMAPEQVRAAPIDARTDLYAMGLVLFHLVTARLPFSGLTPMEQAQSRLREAPTPVLSVRPDVPQWLADVITRALQTNPASRFQSANEFRAALERGLGVSPSTSLITGVAAVPPELVETMMPGAMPVPEGLRPDPNRTVLRRTATGTGTASTTGATGTTGTTGTAGTKGTTGPAGTTDTAGTAGTTGTSRGVLVGLGVAAVIAIVAVATWMQSSPGESVAPQAPAAVTSEPAAAVVTPVQQPVSAPADTTSPPVAASEPPSPPSEAGAAPVQGRSSESAAAGAGRSGRSVAVGAGGIAGRSGPALPDALLKVENVRLLAVDGRRGQDRRAILFLGGGQISIVGSEDNAGLAALPYGDLVEATYARAREPRWNASLAAPPENLDVPGGIFRGSRHWLVLQSKATYIVLSLEDANWSQVVEAVTARTGVKVVQASR